MTKNSIRTMYRRGAYKEMKVVHEERAKGNISYRSAGSHSPVDVTVIDRKKKHIYLLQMKSKKMSQSAVQKLLMDFGLLNTEGWHVEFRVIQ